MGDLELYAQAEEARAEVRRLSRTLIDERAKRVRLEETITLAARAAFAAWEPPKVGKAAADRRGKGEEVAVACCSDWHYGAVSPDFDRAVCEKRVKRYAYKILSLAQIQRADHPVRTCRLWALGDLVGGEQIFPGQEHEVDASLVEQSFGAARLLSDLCYRLLEGFDTVHVVGVPGNHGRIGGKHMPYDPDTNADRIVYLVAQERTRTDRVTWNVARAARGESGRLLVDRIGQYGALLLHGDLFRGGGGMAGLPYYSWNTKALKWRDMMLAGQVEPFDDIMCGHWHRTNTVEVGTMTLRTSGSLQTYDPFSREQVAAATRPAQTLLFVSPSRGRVTAEYRVDLAE